MAITREHDDAALLYRLRPNCSLSWPLTKAVFAGFALVMLASALYWVSRGAWLVLPFFGVELLVVGLGLYLSALAGHRHQEIRIGADAIEVRSGVRRIDTRVRFSRARVRLMLVADARGWHPSRLFLSGGGTEVELGARLIESERRQLAEDLVAALDLRTESIRELSDDVLTFGAVARGTERARPVGAAEQGHLAPGYGRTPDPITNDTMPDCGDLHPSAAFRYDGSRAGLLFAMRGRSTAEPDDLIPINRASGAPAALRLQTRSQPKPKV